MSPEELARAEGPETLEELEAQLLLLETLQAAAPAAEEAALAPVPRDGRELPASFAQERLWFIDQLDPGSAVYNIPAALRLTGPLRVAALAAVLTEVARRHEVLRTRYEERQGRPVQRIEPPAPVRLPVVDLGGVAAGEREEALARWAAAEAVRPFDLAAGPVLRAVLLRLGPAEHAALLTLHHVAADGWSVGVLIREVSELYRAFAAGHPSPLAELPVQYADFASWQRRRLEGARLEEEIRGWRQRLAGMPAHLELPADRPRPARRSARGGKLAFRLPADVSAALDRLGREAGATPFMTLLAGFTALLGRYARQDDFGVGTAVAGRGRAQLEGLIGFFVNTVVLRADLAGRPGFRTLVARCRATALDAFEHQDVPFERLVEELAPERSLLHTPLFQVLFGLDNAPAGDLAVGELALAPVRTGAVTNKFDLSLAMVDEGAAYGGLLSWSQDLFDATTARRMAGHLARLLAAAVAAPERPVDELPLLSAAERHQLVAAWSGLDAAAPAPVAAGAGADAPLHLRFLAQAARRPDAVAVVGEVDGETVQLSFGEVTRRAAAVADRLRALGVGAEVPVAIHLGRSPRWVEALLGTIAAGGCYVPLEEGTPPARLAALVAATGAAAVLCEERTAAALAAALPPGLPVLPLDGLDELEVDGEAAGDPAGGGPPVDPRQLAYVLFTSGSTGRPKGVAVEHRQLAGYLAGITAHLGPLSGRRLAVVSTFAADLGLTMVLPALSAGATLLVAPREVVADAERFAGWSRRHGVDGLKIVPSHLAALLAGDDPAGVLPREVLVLGGEAADPALVARVRELAPGLAVHNHYGPTETTVGAVAKRLGPPWRGGGETAPPLGRPLAGARAWVVDRSDAPSPLGVPGELLLGGVGVARGYLGAPAATAERFVPDPFGVVGGRLYRTGDLARWRPAGELEFLGRVDLQVKVRGYRVEPGEVERALASLPGVREAAVVAAGEGAERRLAGFWVGSAAAAEGAEAALREGLRRLLPEWMVPTILVALPELPRTPNGKVDRRALAARAPVSDERPGGGEAPRGPLEEVLGEIWSEVLGARRVTRDDDFFRLGGHSLLATRVMSRVRRAVGADVELRALFEAPTLAAFAARVAAARADGSATPVPPPVPVGRGRELPLSFAQERLWFLDRLEPGGHAYNVPVSLRLSGDLSAAAIEAALGEVVRRHEVLRTVYGESAEAEREAPVQRPLPPAPVPLPVVDLAALPAAERESALGRLAEREARRPFDLAAGPVLRARLARLGDGEHALLLTLHHIASDGWSRGILVEELSALYGSARAGSAPPLAEPAVQYADYAVWQRGWLAGDTLARETEWWRERLRGLPAVLELPADRPRPPVQSHRGASRFFRLPPDLSGEALALSRRLGATPFMTLLAAFEALLGRLSGETLFAVGTPVAGRTRVEIERLVGFFVNTLVVRADLAREPSFAELVERVREEALEVHAHQDLPFEKLVEELAPERSLSHAPLFQVMFALQNVAPPVAAAGELRLDALEAERGSAKFDLFLALQERGGRLSGEAEYASDLFDGTTIERWLRHFERLLAAAVAEPERPVATLPLLGEAERRQLVEEWGRGREEEPSDVAGGVVERFARQAALRPDAVALAWDGGAQSYGALAARVERLAGRLAGEGVGVETRVAVAMERSAELVVALLAVLRAGGAYVALEPDQPAERLALLLADSEAALLLTDAAVEPRLPSGDEPPRRRVDELERAAERGVEAGGDRAPAGLPSPEQLAYVAYTSGSTGRPKGVAVPHRAVARLVDGAGHARLGPGERFLLLAPVSFDASTLELWGPLATGGTVAVAPPGRLSLEEIGGAVARLGVSSLWLTAGLFHLMVDERLADLAPLGQLLAGGDVLSPLHVRRVLGELPHLRLVNGYGPTENTTFTACHVFDPAAPPVAAAPLGRPIGGTTTYVVDGRLAPVPVGVAGELVTGGAGVARGYLGAPAATAERFVPDPFAGEPGSRLYRTGDQARWRTDGELEFLGRLDRQVKVRGFRIEPAEVERALAAQPGVREAAVVALGEGAGDKRLAAFWVAEEGSAGRAGVVGEAAVSAGTADRVVEEAAGSDASRAVPDEASLREALRRRLPEWMVPATFTRLAALPLTPNGKVDRRALAALEVAPASAGGTAPVGLFEEMTAAIWGEVLEVEEVPREADFFALGGHSLLATRVVSRVRRAFGVEVELRMLFEAPALAEFAARVAQAAQAAEPGVASPPLVAGPIEGDLPLSFAQERLWFIDRLAPGLPLYNVPSAVHWRGGLAPASLAAALTTVVGRHAVLRTVYGDVEGRPVQRVVPAAPVPLPVVDLAALPPSRRQAEARRRARAEASRPFDLGRGPVLRAAVVHLAAEEHLLVLTLHHIATDGWSMEVLQRELAEAYRAHREGRAPRLPELPLQYADYAAWQRRRLDEPALARETAWWRERLAGLPAVLELPADRPRPAVASHRGGRRGVELAPELAAPLLALGRRLGATPFMTLLAGFEALLGRLSGEPRFAVATPVAGRTHREIEPLVGFFVNTLALLAELGDGPGLATLVARAREEVLAAHAHQELPFERLVGELAPERSLAHEPLVQVMFALGRGGGAGAVAEEMAAPAADQLPTPPRAPADSGSAKLDLFLAMHEGGGRLTGEAEYAADLFDGTTIERWLGHFERLLEAAVAEPERPVATLPLLGEAERRQVVETWGAGEAVPAWSGDATLADLVAAQAARTPDAVAVVGPHGESLSYGALLARADRLAAELAARGVGPEVRVAVCLERTPRLVEALVAVLRAGGAYVPLDPAYPAERLAFMLADSGAAVALVEADTEALLPPFEGERLRVDRLAAAEDLGGPAPAPRRAGAANLAYLIYTSGSTGRPKGVAIEHGSAVARVAWSLARYSADEVAAVLAATSVCFDLSVWELFVPLSSGGRAVLAAHALALAEHPAAATVTLVNTVPSAMGELVRAGALPGSVVTVNLAGEPLGRPLADAVFAAGVARLVNLYGPSEDTTYSTSAEVGRDAGKPAIGRPLAGGRALVLDASLAPVPAGVAGELYLGGAGLARGYLGRPALTAGRWLPDAVSGEPGARLYRTGDLARWRADGELDFLGRLDHQVKVRGFRIELGEVERALAAEPGVAEAAVLALGEDTGKRLAAFWVAAEGPAGDQGASVVEEARRAADAARPAAGEASLREALRRRLPEWMVPATFTRLAALPLTPNGKVDRRVLAALEVSPASAGGTAPVGLFEEMTAAIWGEVLEVEEVPREADFFALGGHSLLATRVVSRVRRAFGVEIELRALFEAPALAEFAARVALAARAAEPGVAEPPLVAGPAEGDLPLSFAQERLWFVDRLAPGRATYNMPSSLRLGGPLSVPALSAARAEMVRRHQVLRTTYHDTPAGPVQRVGPPPSAALPVVDLSFLRPREREARLHQLFGRAARRPFDLEHGPVQRAHVVRLAEREHVVLSAVHHIASDGWSQELLANELSTLFAAYRRGEPSPLPELPVQYADYAAWQRRRLTGEALARETSWWRARLAGLPALLELPTDRPRPPVQSHRGAARSRRLAESLSGRVAHASRSLGATPFMTLLAAFQVLLGRLSGQPRFAVGTPVAGRDQVELEGLVGFFVNTLVVGADLADGPGFATLVARAREEVLAAHAHQGLPFEKLVGELAPERSLAHEPVVQVMFALQGAGAAARAASAASALAGADASLASGGAVDLDSGSAKFDLHLAMEQSGERLLAGAQFATDLFDGATIERWLGHLERLLEAALAEPERPVATLPLLGEAERRQLVEEWGRGGEEGAAVTAGSVVERFARQAALRPDAVALAWDGGVQSYGELAARVERLAGRLADEGVGAETRVAVAMERSAELVVALLAVLRAGGAYVALEPDLPAERLALLLADSGAALLLTDAAVEPRLPSGDEPPRRRVDELERAAERGVEAGGDRAPAGLPSPEQLAYVAYTSGSTGRPKGVAVPHRAVARLVDGAGHARLGPGERFLLLAPVSFDASTLELWGPLATGGTVAVAPPGRLSLEEIGGAVARLGVTSLWLTAGLFHLMVDERLADLAPLGQLLAGGDVLSPPHVRRVLGELPHLRLVNGYGPTENTTFTACYVFDPAAPPVAAAPLGRPIGGTTAYVVDGRLAPVPVGVAGELVTGGAGVARGYLGAPAATAERFVPDPFAGEPGSRLYRTGDRARWRTDGELEFLGRLDRQVKVRGFRIEPAEVERALAAQPGVREAAVVALGEGAGDKRLAAFWVAETGSAGGAAVVGEARASAGAADRVVEQAATEAAGASASRAVPAEASLREALRRRLPEWMVPATFTRLPALPLTPNGKVDRRALAALETGRQAAGEAAGGTAPVGLFEEMTAAIWGEVLEVEEVPREADFFALGGHSLLATRVVSRVRRAFGVEVELRALFEAPALAEFAARVALAARAAEPGVAAPPLVAGPIEGDLPLSFAQERLWFIDRLAPGLPLYNVPSAVRWRGELEPASLGAALTTVVGRHAVLRTVYGDVEGRPVQRVVPAAPVPLPVVDLVALPPSRRQAEARRRARAEASRPFDLGRGPVLRAAVVRLAAEEHLLLLTLHHIATDGWSMEVLQRELAEAYRAHREGRAPRLPELPVQYADYAAWQRRRLDEPALARETAWWRERLAGLPAVLELPADRPRPAVASHRGGRRGVELASELAAPLLALGRRLGATPFMTLLAGFEALLGRLSGEPRFAVAMPVAGRTHREIEPLVGFFVNTLALRAEVGDGPGLATLVARAREEVLAAHAHQELPFERLVGELAPERSLAHEPLVQVMFALGRGGGAGAVADGLAADDPIPAPPGAPADSGSAKLDLFLAMHEGGGRLTGEAEYAADLFDGTTIERWLGHFERLLEAAVAEPERPVATLPLLGEAERRQVVETWGAAEAVPAWSGDATLADLVAAQAARTPDAVAVVGPRGESLSYGVLLARADRLAAELAARGVGLEVRVAVCLERTPRLVEALVAVLRAGGAYVPLDPAYPAERLAFMLADSGAAVALVEADTEALLPSFAGERLRVDGLSAAGGPPAAPAPRRAGAANLAYLIYTSGSTGRPKGVAIEHGSAVARVAWSLARYSTDEVAAVLAATSVCFDLSVWELFVPLSSGGRAVLAAHALALAEHPAAAAVTLVNTVPSAMGELVRAGALPGSVVTVNLAGEPLGRPLADAVFAAGVGRLVNLYGPSEDTTYSTSAEVGRDGGKPAIGRPLAGGRALVLDASLEPVPAGVAGELYLGGSGLARGYLGRPALTAERWLPDAVSGEPGARLYRTGDLARWRADGELDFLGRLDHQVKVRGFRIELGEVERALAAEPGVAEAAVLALGEGTGKRLAAFWVAAEGPAGPAGATGTAVEDAAAETAGTARTPGDKGASVAEAPRRAADASRAVPAEGSLREALRRRLPEWMVPATFTRLAALPLTPNGKVDRRALAALEVAPASAGGTAPVGLFEEMTAAIWGEVLEVEEVPREADFFALGGHSLLATRVVSRVRRAFGVEVELRMLFEAPALAEFAARVAQAARAAQAAEPGVASPPLVAGPIEGDLPLSFAQERLWFIDRLAPGLPLYNVPSAVRWRGGLAPASLAAALTMVVGRHAVLRTVYGDVEGRPVQRVVPAAPVPLPVVDLAALPPSRRQAEARRRARAEASRPFDLGRGPVLRAAVVRLAAEEHLLLLTLHHIATDGWSMEVLQRELAEAYRAHREGRAPRLPELPVQYADYAAWQRRRLDEPALARETAWWRERLAGLPAVLELPADRPRPAVASHRGGRRAVELAPELAAPLLALGRRLGATPFMTLLAGFEALLGRLSGEPRFAVATPVAGRTHREIEPLVGFFVNTLALRAELGDGPGLATLVARAREEVLAAHAHQELPFERLVGELAPERSLAHEPLVQVMFALGRGGGAGAVADRRSDAEAAGQLPTPPRAPADSGSAKLDFFLALEERGGRLSGEAEYAADLFDGATIERWLGLFERLLAAAVAEPERPVATLPLLDEAERRQLVEEWGRGREEEPSDATGGVVERFARQAALRPDAVALAWDGGAQSYGALAARVERLAERLAAEGVGAETRVAVAMERSAELVVALLAVLRAGGAYVALEPDQPAERLALLLADSGAALLLTDAVVEPRLPPGEVPPRRRVDELERALEGAVVDTPERGGDRAPAAMPSPEQLAYVAYTSGSTGRTKGVAVPHRAVARLVDGTGHARLGPGERFLLLAPVSFDASTLELWGPLATGGTVAVAPPGRLSLEEIGGAVARLGVSSLWLTAGLFHLMVDERLADLAPLGQLLAGGDVLSPPHVRRVLGELPHLRLVNGYGPTENTTFTACHVFDPAAPPAAAAPLGRPIGGTTTYVVDGRLAPVPVGVAGELVTGGAGVARGYLGAPAATAERFVPDPFAGEPGSRLYRTGDRARWRTDGELEFLGRLDRQVKVRGFRIEPAEVERALTAQPRVREAAVVALGEGAGDKRLAAFWVAEEGSAGGAGAVVGEAPRVPAEAFLREALRGLPEWMVPVTFTRLAALPLTPNGKVDRRALAALAPAEGGAAAPLPPRTGVETALVRLWEQVLERDDVGVRDDFFRLGGHSLLALRLQGAIERRFGTRLPLAELFRGATIERLAGLLTGGAARTPLVRLRQGEEKPPLFLFHAAGGGVAPYLHLTDALAPGRAVWGLQAAGLDGDEPLAHLGLMAERHAAELRRLRPQGPYHLAGWSVGGLLALETARRLAEAGGTVAWLGMFDTAAPTTADAASLPADTIGWLTEFAATLGVERVRAALAPAAVAGLTPERALVRIVAAGGGVEGLGEAELLRLFRVFRATLEAAVAYRPPPRWPGPVTLFVAARSPRRRDPFLGWGGLAAGAPRRVEVAGDHRSMIEDPAHAAVLAAALDARLDEA